MGFLDLVKQFVRPHALVAPKPRRGEGERAKSSAAGPMIAWSNVGQPVWTPRRYENMAEEGFRKNVIAYRSVMLIATAAAAVPWLLYDDGGQEVDQHPLLDLLRHPNPLQDGVSFMEAVYAYLEISGNAYIEAVPPAQGQKPVELYVLRPDRMRVIPGPAGLPQGYQYSVNGQVTSWGADPVTGASCILHLRRFNPLDDWYGLAPLEAAQISVDQHNAAGAWNQALLNHGARPSGALVYAPKDGGPATLTDDQITRLREEVGQLYQGSRNAGRPLILEGGLDWREMSLSPKDMDWLAGRNTAARDIALAFGVPAQMVGIPDSQTYANMAEARMAFYEETVLPAVTRVIAGFDHWLTPMFGNDLELDFDPDAISALTPRRDQQWSKLNGAGFLTQNEKREAAGYGPVPGGDANNDSYDGDADDEAVTPNASGMLPGEAQVLPKRYAWEPRAWNKFNPNHDPDNGQFTFGSGGGDDGNDDDDDSGDDDDGGDYDDGPPGRGRGIWKLPDEQPRSSQVNDAGSSKTPAGAIYDNAIQNDMVKRDWTPQQIDDAVQNGDRIDAVNKLTGDPATRYVNPDTGKSVVIDNTTNEVIQVGGTGFKFGVGSGDMPGAVMRSPPSGEGGGGGSGGGGVPPNPKLPNTPQSPWEIEDE